ncbi:MAG: hypothetical protein ACXWPM_05585 [Bdellovibrionota bacterium]
MKKYGVVISMVLSLAPSAFADGFVCRGVDGDAAVKVYNNTQAAIGTRTGAVLVVSNPLADSGAKTVARVTDVKGTLSSSGADYLANVDLRFKDSHKNAEVAGIALSELDTIELQIDFRYGDNLKVGETTSGTLVLEKREGGRIVRQMDCERYLKN